MHASQKLWVEELRSRQPSLFTGRSVTDVGSLDVNGNNRYLFEDCKYLGIDIVDGPNVDFLSSATAWADGGRHSEIVISTNMLEHDPGWRDSLAAMFKIATRAVIVHACGPGHPEHGTLAHPCRGMQNLQTYYKNLDASDFLSVPHPDWEMLLIERVKSDTFLFGVKP